MIKSPRLLIKSSNWPILSVITVFTNTLSFDCNNVTIAPSAFNFSGVFTVPEIDDCAKDDKEIDEPIANKIK